MSVLDSLVISLFGLSFVFVILVTLSGIVTIQSKLVGSFLKKRSAATETEIDEQASEVSAVVLDPNVTGGDLKLIGVDEKTAAIIMAIVSDESKMPLNELQFRYIKAME